MWRRCEWILGWLFRCVSNPGRFVPRYAKALGRAAMERAIQKLPIKAKFVVRAQQEEVQV